MIIIFLYIGIIYSIPNVSSMNYFKKILLLLFLMISTVNVLLSHLSN